MAVTMVPPPPRLTIREAWRLAMYKATHPGVVVGDVGFGVWQARIPEPTGEFIVTRYSFGELMDRLDELDGELDDTG